MIKGVTNSANLQEHWTLAVSSRQSAVGIQWSVVGGWQLAVGSQQERERFFLKLLLMIPSITNKKLLKKMSNSMIFIHCYYKIFVKLKL